MGDQERGGGAECDTTGVSDREKGLFIRAYLGDLRERIDFLETLMANGHEAEALLLCCCYIDGLAQGLYFPEELGSHEGFVRVIREQGGDPFLPLIHPRQMLLALNRRPALAPVRETIRPLLEGAELVREEEFLAGARSLLDDSGYAKLRSFAWRGTMASLAYEQLRSPVVHRLRGPAAISFDRTCYRGQPVPLIRFEVLRPVLDRIFAEATRVSTEHGRFL